MSFDGEAIQQIVDLAPPKQLQIDGRQYVSRPVYLLPEPKTAFYGPDLLRITSLSGVVDYVSKFPDPILKGTDAIAGLFVPDHTQVHVVGNLQENGVRPVWLVSQFIREQRLAGVGSYDELDALMISILTGFVDTPARKTLLSLFSQIKVEDGADVSDDGMTINVTLKTGISVVKRDQVSSIFELRPHRVFPEIPQPPTTYVLRLRRSGGDVEAGLFPSQDTGWKNEAIDSIKAYLNQKLPNIPIIG